jgi:DNA polymerase-3 subunit gamma/tau
LLGVWTGRRWNVAVNSVDPAEATLAEQEQATETRRREDAAAHPLIEAVMAAFPGAAIEAVRDIAPDEPADEDGVLDTELPIGGEDDP